MKTQLKDSIWIDGFNKLPEVYAFKDNMCIVGEAVPYIYIGKTSEIPEELAKECVLNWNIDGLYNNYKIESQYEEYMFKTAKESIQSACSQEYCIIYKTK